MPAASWVLLLIPNALNILWLGPVTNAVQHLVPPQMRATASASFLMINNLIGLGVGPMLMGALSDHFTASYGVDALRNAVILRSEEHTSELQSLMRISYAVFCLKKKKTTKATPTEH